MTLNEKIWSQPLNELENRFAYEYLLDPTNGTQAFMRAFQAVRGKACSFGHAAKKAHELLKRDPRIIEKVNAKREELDEELALNATRVLREIMQIAFSDIRDAFTVESDKDDKKEDEGDEKAKKKDRKDKLKKIRKLPPGIAKSVQSIKFNKDGTPAELKLYDKGSALKKLCDHLGLSKQGSALEELLALMQMAQSKRDETEIIDNGPGPGQGPA